MALIYTKLTDKTTVLSPREGAGRKFNFGTDWTEIRLGMFCSAVAATGSNDVNVPESSASSGITDFITFGIKDDSPTYPGQVGSTFLGIRSGGTLNASTPTNTYSGNDWWLTTGYFGATMVQNPTTMAPSVYLGGAAPASAATGYCCFFAIKIIISNRGLSSQSVTISVENGAGQVVPGSDYSPTALRTLLNNSVYGTGQAIAWNDGVTARAIPDCVWVRVPLYLNALRISCVRAIRYAP